jgi:AraC family transcriptional regulator
MNMAVLDQETYQLAIAFQAALQDSPRPELQSLQQLGMRLCQQLVVRYEDRVADIRDRVALAPWQERKAKRILASPCQDKLSIAEVASQCSMSRSHFSRAFKKTTGMSPQEWTLKSRIERAQLLIAEGSMSMCQVAFECGFSDQSHFTRTFRKLTGISPKRWQRSQQSSLEVA